MKKIITSALLSALFLRAGLFAQLEGVAQTCNVTFFNATTVEAPLFLDWSGRQAFPDGLSPGRSMGPIMMQADTASLEASAEPLLPAKGSIELAAGQGTILVFYEGPPEVDPDERGARRPRLRIFQTPLQPTVAEAREFVWPALYVGSETSIEIEVNGAKRTVPRGKSTVISRGESFVTVSKDDEQLLSVSAEEPTGALIVIYGEADDLRAGIAYR